MVDRWLWYRVILVIFLAFILSACQGWMSDELPVLDVSSAAVNEGDSGNQTLAFTLTLNAPSDKDVSVDFATADAVTGNAATAGADYQPASGTLTIPGGSTSATVVVMIIGDTDAEADEMFVLKLSDPVNATLGAAEAVGTILNDDAPVSRPTVSLSSVSLAEGENGTRPLAFTVTLSASTSEDVSVDFATADPAIGNAATAGSDYQPASGTLTIPGGSTSATVVVRIVGDTEVEADETFLLKLSNPVNATLAASEAIGTILNDDMPSVLPEITTFPAAANEGDSGNQTLVFTLSLSVSASEDVRVDFATEDATATAGSDYQSASDTATIAAGDTSTTVAVTIVGDIDVEVDETFLLKLTNPVNATLAASEVVGTIVNDDILVVTDACVHTGSGNDYPVGPGMTYTSISDVPWGTLGPGDTVRIHYRAAPYKEKVVISTDGTEQNPIRVCGVAGPNGERPILDGDGAVNDPDDSSAYSTWPPMEGLAMIMLWNQDYDLKVHNIIIDGLHIRNAKNTYSYTRMDGSSDSYENGAACIRIQAGDNIVIRNNELENCSNGIFTMSQGYNEAHLTRNLLIEGNYLHGHSQAGSYREHGVYIQALGVVYQYNRFGANAPGSKGVTLKERVAGSVIRYNWFDSGSSRALDLVEVEDAAPWYIEQEYRNWAVANGEAIDPDRLAKVQAAEAAYRDTHVYGNFFRHIGSQTEAGSLVHYGWDNDPALAREGRLHFYHNTVSILEDRSDNWRFRLFDMRQSWDGDFSKEVVEAFNNIIYFSSETAGAEPAYLCMSNDSGTVNLGVNWMTNSWESQEAWSECYPYAAQGEQPTVSGVDNLLDVTGAPRPIAPDSLVSNDTPLVQGTAQSIPPEVNSKHPVTEQYVAHQKHESRNSVSDLGAMELP